MRRTILPLVLLAAVGCQPATMEMTEEQRAEVEQSVRAAVLEVWASFYNEDIAAYMDGHSGWAGSPWGCCETFDGLSTYAQDFWNRWDIDSHEEGEVSVMVLSPDAAAVRFVAEIARTDTTGVHQEWRWDQAMLMVREAGVWKLVVGKNTTSRTDTE